MVVVFSVGRAEQGGPHAGDRLNLIAAGVDVGHDLLGGKGVKVGVVVGVVHDLVAGVREGFYRLGVFVHPLADHEEGNLYIIFSQNVDELLGVLVSPG